MRTVLAFMFTVAAATVFGQSPDGGDPLKQFDKNGDAGSQVLDQRSRMDSR